MSDGLAARLRAGLPAVVDRAYLNTGTYGPLPDVARTAMRAHLDRVTETGRIGAAGLEHWQLLQGEVRRALADALGAEPENLALMHSVTDGVNTVLAGLRFEAGDEILVGDVEHPGLLEPLAWLHERYGVRIITVPVSRGRAVGALAAAVTGRTRLIALSHVLWTTGEVLDLPGVIEVAARAGIPVLCDGAQSAGAIPVNLTELGCDFYAVPGQKWLCGPSGTGILYVRPDRVPLLAPAWRSYLTRDRLPGSPGTELWPAARRYDVGMVTMTALAGLAAAVRWRVEQDLPAGVAAGIALAAAARVELAAVRGVVVDDPGCDTPFASVTLGSGSPVEAIVTDLERAGVLVRWIPGDPPRVRATIGPWNTAADVTRFAEALATAIR